MFHLALVYDESGKRYILPFEIFEKYIDKKTLGKITAEAIRQVQQL